MTTDKETPPEQKDTGNQDTVAAEPVQEERILKNVECKPWSLPSMQSRTKEPFSQKYVKPDYFQKIQDRKRNYVVEEAKKGYDEGFAKGEREAKAKGEGIYKEKAQTLDSLFADLKTQLAELQPQLELRVLELVKVIASNVITRELATQDEIIQSVVQTCLAKLPKQSSDLTLQLNDEDAKTIEKALADNLLPGLKGANIVTDPKITKGGCKVLTANSVIDATLEHRINEIFSELDKHIDTEASDDKTD